MTRTGKRLNTWRFLGSLVYFVISVSTGLDCDKFGSSMCMDAGSRGLSGAPAKDQRRADRFPQLRNRWIARSLTVSPFVPTDRTCLPGSLPRQY
jgi:hypothetical protein